ncbi:MAG: L-tyrosine/L-tryptophan isonitrile synthase family protein [Stackebrandtia sp.]
MTTPARFKSDVELKSLDVLALLLPHRRTGNPGEVATLDDFAPQLRQISAFVAADEPIVFTLPAFPCKSPNLAKVLGRQPDEGERLSLRFLDELCAEVEKVYSPGARLLICSDGHVFGDLIQVPDSHIDAYGRGLRDMLTENDLSRLHTFDLSDVFGDLSFNDKRAEIVRRYGPTIEQLRAEVHADEQARRLYLGITRFLVEDAAEFFGTRSALQRQCRQRAYGVIQRSRAWSKLIADHHRQQVRLSIHPQALGSAKFGIALLEGPDAWTTPWHSVALYHNDGSVELTRRDRAEQLGRLAYRGGRPSHFHQGG